MAAADLLVHPARHDTTGTVILEAIVNGLPVVTTSICGYPQHVDAAEAGIVINEPFGYNAFAAALSAAADAGRAAAGPRRPSNMARNPSFMTAARARRKSSLRRQPSGFAGTGRRNRGQARVRRSRLSP